MDQWLKYLRNEFPTIAFKASTQSQKQNLVSELIVVYLVYFLLVMIDTLLQTVSFRDTDREI